MNYPPGCDSPRKKMQCLVRTEELLKDLYNLMGRWYTQGITEEEYESIPSNLRAKYPDTDWTEQLTEQQFRTFQNVYYDEMVNTNADEESEQRAVMRQDDEYELDLNELLE